MTRLLAGLLTFVLTLWCSSASAQDYVREKHWADEIVPDLVVGDALRLRQANGHEFLGLYVEAKDAKAAVLLVHGRGVQPDFGVIGELRVALGDMGYTTRSIQMPVLAPDSARLSRKGSFLLGADGTLTGELSYTFTGGAAAALRGSLKEQSAKDVRQTWEQSLGSMLPGLSLDGFEFHTTPGLDKPLSLDLHLSVPGYGRQAGPLQLVRPRVLGSYTRDLPGGMDGEARKYPIELGHPGIWTDSYDIKLPAGYTVDEIPDPVKVDLPFASYHSSVAAKGDVLHFESEYVVKQVEVPAAQAVQFRALEDAIVTDEKGMAVLKKE